MPDLNMPQQPRQGFMPRMAAMMAQPVDAVAAGIMKSQSKRAEAALEGFGGAESDSALPVNSNTVRDIVEVLKKYQAGKASLDERIVEEERWYRLRHWDVIRNKKHTEKLRGDELRPEPASAWMFNSIANKHADLMDNYPEPNVLPRQRDDERDAKRLSHILPVIFERNNYERTYDEAGWYKLKHGVSAKGVFWNGSLEDGLGDVDIHMLDILNIFWEPGITDIQRSRNFFITTMMDNDLLEAQYPKLKGKLDSKIITPKEYVHDDTIDTTEKSIVVDWYYKKANAEGKTILHFCKFVGDQVLFASENEPDKYPNGFYDHGKYPVVLDVLFPLSGTPVGFGYIALMKSPQLYIDKLDQSILENSLMSARPRYMAKKDLSGINLEEFADWSKPIVFYEGDKDNIFPMEMPTLPASVMNVRQMKVDELKETSSNRDVSQGSSSGGVTAAAAIAALQEAGNKTSRDMIGRSYRAYAEENYIAIELVRQFYSIARHFRIVGQDGHAEFIQYSNANIRGVAMPPAYAGQEMQPGYVAAQRKPIFDIVVKPQKRSPYSKMAQNELAKELYQLGFFNPQLADQSLAALDLMEFDGIEMVREKIQQGQTLMNQLIMMQQQMQKMGMIIYSLTGQDVLGMGMAAQTGGGGKTPTPPHSSENTGKSMGSAQTDAAKATMTSYGQRLAARAKPDMNSA